MGVDGRPKTAIGAAIALAAVVGIGLALYAGMGGVAANARPEAAAVDSPAQDDLPEGIPEITEETHFNDENFAVLYENFGAFAGLSIDVDITGQVVGIPWMEEELPSEDQTGSTMSFQMYQGRNILDYRYLSVSYDLGQSPAVESLDCVHVTGTAEGYRVFTDQHGPYTLPNIVDAKVERLDCVDYLYPAEGAVTVGVTETHGGISVTLEKVEFAREHTRAYLVVANTNSEPINFLEGARVAYQGHHHYTHLESALNVHMPEIEYTIMPGEVQHGIVLFKPLDYTHDSKFKFAAKNGYDSYVFTFEVASPAHGHGEPEEHGQEESEEHAEEGHETVEDDHAEEEQESSGH